MSLLPRKGLLAIAAVVDVALQTDERPISAKTLATRHGLPPRHLESVLQSLGARRHPQGHPRPARRLRAGARAPRRDGRTIFCAPPARCTNPERSRARSSIAQSRASGAVGRRAGIWTGAEPHQFGRHGAPRRTPERQSRSRDRRRNRAVRGPFTIWTLSARFPLESKVERFAGLLAMDPLAMAVTASRGKGACRTRSGGAGASLVRGSADSRWPLDADLDFRLSARRPADQPPKLVLHEFVLGATRSIDRHEVAAFVLLVGLLLFAVVTAILLLRTRPRLSRLETSSHDEIAALRSDLDRANALLLSEPQVMVDWPAASDEPTIEGDPAIVGASAPHRVLAFGSWLDPPGPPRWSRRSRPCAPAAKPFSMAFTTLGGRPIEAQGRAIAGRAVLRLKDASGVKRELLDLAGRHEALLQRGRFAARPGREAAVAGMDARRRRPTDLRQRRLRAGGRSADAADAIERDLELLDSSARESIARARARFRRLFRPASRDRRRRAAQLRRARFSHRGRQRRARRRRHRSRNDAQRARPHDRRAPPHCSISFRPASPCSTPAKS